MFKNTNYIFLCNNMLKLGNTKERTFGGSSIKINLELWHRIWMSAIFGIQTVFQQRQDQLREQMLLQKTAIQNLNFQWGLNTTGL